MPYFKAILLLSSRARIPAASHQILKQTRSLRQDVISPLDTENTCPATNSLCFVNAVVTVVSLSLATSCERYNPPPQSSPTEEKHVVHDQGQEEDMWDEGKGHQLNKK